MHPPAAAAAQALDEILARHAPLTRSALLPVLIEAQRLDGYLSEPLVERIARRMHIPPAEIFGVIAFYSMLYDRPVGRTVVRVCTSPRCAQLGGEQALEAAVRHLGVAPGQVSADGAYSVEAVACLCLCDQAPAALIGERTSVRLAPQDPSSWIERPQPSDLGVIDGAPRWITARCGQVEPTDLQAYAAHGGLAGLQRVLKTMTPAQWINEVQAAGLLGRGGAAFPSATKWRAAAETPADERFVLCNADESEPGTFKDRLLMEADPLALLEGMVLAGYAIGARRGYLYIRGEYPRAQAVVAQALRAAREAGVVGGDVLGRGFAFEIELRSGAGAYICGEETALIESLEGKRGFPRLRPPYPTTHGLFGRPTVINNVETLCAATWIAAHGAQAFRDQGTPRSPGTKLYCVSGDVQRPGTYEAGLGIPLGELLALAGGVSGELQAVLLGGAAGAFVGPERLELSMSYEALAEAGLPLGSGVVMAINTRRDLRRTLLSLARFFAHESCGKCFPCRLGTQRQLEIVEKVAGGVASPQDLEALEDVGAVMTETSICGLGTTAATAILSARARWPELFLPARGEA